MPKLCKRSSLLRYPGGKGKFTILIADILNKSGLQNVVFIEPFCGGAGVSISLLEAGLVEKIVINDLDPLVSAFWACVFSEEDSIWLANQIKKIPLTLDEWHKQKNSNPQTLRTKALKALFLNRTSFNGILHRAGPVGGAAQSKYNVGSRFNREKLAARVLELRDLRDSVTVLNEDWKTVFVKYSRCKNTFAYCDPPYFYKADLLYGYIFDDEMHKELRNYLCKTKKSWVLSYDDTKEIRELYSTCKSAKFAINTSYSAHPQGGSSIIGKELLYTNVNLTSKQDTFKLKEGSLQATSLNVT